MKFDYFQSVKSKKGEQCTDEVFVRAINSKEVCSLCKKIAAEEDHDKQGVLKKGLPIITWMASFNGGQRLISNATPSGLYMMDIDGIEDPEKVWEEIKEKDPKALGIMIAHKTPSAHGLRIVALNREGLDSVVQNQEWFASQFPNIKFDTCVKDLARSSFLVPFSYFYYTDMNIFKSMCPVYIKEGGKSSSTDSNTASHDADSTSGTKDLGTYVFKGYQYFNVERKTDLLGDESAPIEEDELVYDGLDLRTIVLEWLAQHGGEPKQGSRNTTLFQLFCSLRYICDFQTDIMLASVPAILSRFETCELIENAKKRDRIVGIPKDILAAVKALKDNENEDDETSKKTIYDYLQSTNDLLAVEKLPPIFKQFAQIAPPDFRKASVVALLPLLGTLGSRLRAVYVDGVEQTPSFQCEIEAPMASGKSFARRIFNIVMEDVIEQDNAYRDKEAKYEEKVRLAKNAKEQPEREVYPIRLLGSKVSIAALLDRMANTKGLHVLSFDEEIRNVLDSMRSGAYGDIRALLRCAFDNSIFGQDYKSDSSSKHMVAVFYNTLHCGTPAEYRKLYNNAEDGTITRVLFADIPDQKFKKMPVFKELNYFQLKDIRKQVKRLSNITMQGESVQPPYKLKNFDFMRTWADKWQEDMRQLAIKFNDINLDTYRRRAAVVGFRAGMLAWFLFDKNDAVTRSRTTSFAQMIAEQMCVTLMRRYQVAEVSNSIIFVAVWNKLPETFTADQVEQVVSSTNFKTPSRAIIHRWRERNLILKTDKQTYKKNFK